MFRYLEIMNFGNGDKRTSLLTSFQEKSKEELGKIISGYKVVLKLTENEYKEIDKLLEYKGEESYNELRARISNAIEYIKSQQKIFEEYDIVVDNQLKNLLEILGGE